MSPAILGHEWAGASTRAKTSVQSGEEKDLVTSSGCCRARFSGGTAEGGMRHCLHDPRPANARPRPQVIDIKAQANGLDLVATPLWLYDATRACNVWGNR